MLNFESLGVMGKLLLYRTTTPRTELHSTPKAFNDALRPCLEEFEYVSSRLKRTANLVFRYVGSFNTQDCYEQLGDFFLQYDCVVYVGAMAGELLVFVHFVSTKPPPSEPPKLKDRTGEQHSAASTYVFKARGPGAVERTLTSMHNVQHYEHQLGGPFCR